jgi:RNA polymerase-binding transcription factor DksA
VKEELEQRISNVMHLLASRQRCQGYITLKLKRILPNLRRAIEKVEEGTYGFCDACDEAIPEERLRVVPGAIRCAHCQEIIESLPRPPS